MSENEHDAARPPSNASEAANPRRELDLTGEPANVPPEVMSRATVAPTVEPYDPSRDRERYRGLVAGVLLGVLAFTVGAAFVSFWFNWASQDEIEGLMTIVFAPVVGLVGAATGFYFGAATAGNSRQDPG
jgi:hypothetical protein